MPVNDIQWSPDGVRVNILSTNEDVRQAIEKIAMNNIQFAPASVVIESPYARYVEEGTGPASKDFLRQTDEFGRTTAQRIEAWSHARFATISPVKRKQISYMIYRHIMEHGTDPHPYIRPAVRDTMRSLDPDWYLKGRSTFDLCKKMATRMKYNLTRDPETGESHIYTYALHDSIHVEYNMALIKERVKSVMASDLEDDDIADKDLSSIIE